MSITAPKFSYSSVPLRRGCRAAVPAGVDLPGKRQGVRFAGEVGERGGYFAELSGM
jgi:hypothetical protein